jgi:Lrp/AsnC family transcriptional regulator
MLDDGVIRHRVAVLDHRKIGLRVMVLAQVKLARHASDAVPRFIEAVRTLPQVIECHTLMGNIDFQLKIVVPSIEDYEHFVWQKLSNIEGVQEVNSVISMSQSVNTTELPLPGVERRAPRKVPPRRARAR